MSTSLFLAKLIGPLFLAVRAGLLASAAVYKQLTDEFLTPRALIYFR